jgi:hypothetical protein
VGHLASHDRESSKNRKTDISWASGCPEVVAV